MNRLILLSVTLVVLFAGCSTGSESEGPVEKWTDLGLTDREVISLDVSSDFLFVASRDELFRMETGQAGGSWQNLDLAIDTETSRFSDIFFGGESGLFAVVRNTISYFDLPENYTTLYKSVNLGGSWLPVQLSVQGLDKPYVFKGLVKRKGSNVFYADAGIVLKSVDDGTTWMSSSESGGSSRFIYQSRNHPNQIWIGGVNTLFSPYLAKSADGGDSWTNLNNQVYFNTEATSYGVTVSQEDPQTVLAGFAGGFEQSNVIRKSTDGGQNWETVLEGYVIFDLQNSLQSPGRVYASGFQPDGRLFVAVSIDFGENWQIETFEESPSEILVNDLAIAEEGDSEVLYMGTSKGVFAYRYGL